MDVYTAVPDFVSRLPACRRWQTLPRLVARAATSRPFDWQLPGLVCRSMGGDPTQALPAAAALACMQLSIIFIDDMLDKDPRGIHSEVGVGQAANLAAAFQALGLEALTGSRKTDGVQSNLLLAFNRMALTTAYGQHLDVLGAADEAAYWRLVRFKSSSFFGTALYAGSLLAGARSEVARLLESFGQLYGECIQIHDDLKDAMATPAAPDWRIDRVSLPIMFAEIVDHPSRDRFRLLRRFANDAEALSEAQAILVRCGAVSYCADQLLHRCWALKQLLVKIPLAKPGYMENLVEDLQRPILTLLKHAGVEQPERFLDRTNSHLQQPLAAALQR